jgi:alpha-mannosidase
MNDTQPMRYSEIVILIPSHSLEDFPTDLDDSKSASLLNSFTVAWHPQFLAQADAIPIWHRAEEPPEEVENRLIFVPKPSLELVPNGWIERVREEGAVVIADLEDRAAMLELALAPLRADDDSGENPDSDASIADQDQESGSEQQSETSPVPVDDATTGASAQTANLETAPEDEESSSESDSAAEPASPPVPAPSIADLELDCMALGTTWIMLELLTRHMHHFSSYDEVFFEKTAVNAAKSIINGDAQDAFDRLQSAVDLLTEARERFYPVDSYLLDLCLLTPDMANDKLDLLLHDDVPVNYLLKGDDAEEIAEARPATVELMKERWSVGKVDVIGGDYKELPTPLVPLESTLFDFEKGLKTYRRLFHREPTTWARRRYGLSLMTPQLLHKAGYIGALHVLLDDGIYPDREQSRMHWEGCDSSTIEAFSRIPLAAESASTWIRFPQRMAEAMESDSVAAITVARWPEMKSPFLRDLRRIQKYGSPLGRFVTFAEFFESSDESGGGGYWGADTKEYLAPFFLQAVARQERDPIDRFRQHSLRHASFSAASWHASMAKALMAQPVDDDAVNSVQEIIEAGGPDAFEGYDASPDQPVADANAALEEFETTSQAALARIIMHGAGSEPGWLVTNPLSFTRRVVVDLNEATSAPAVEGPVKHVQFDDSRKQALVEIPAAGYVWIGESGGAKQSETPAPLADSHRLQNEHFEVFVSESTGGLQRIKKHGRTPNRLSQQLAFRFPTEQTIRTQVSEDTVQESKTWYSEMRCSSVEVTCNSDSMGEITTKGDLIDLSTETSVATFTQVFRIWRGRPVLDIEIDIDAKKTPEGDPWSNYYAARFAWNDSTASISQSLYGAAQTIQMQRIESSDFIELASDDERTTIIPNGLPFHRKTSNRMMDSLLVCEGDSCRSFRFSVVIDNAYPMETALAVTSPVKAIRTENGPPRSGNTGWFYHVDTRCVQVTKVSALVVEPPDSSTVAPPSEEKSSQQGFALRMQETEGRYQSVYVELFRTPTNARVRDLRGQTVTELPQSGEGVRVEFSPFGIVDLELFF